MVGGMVLGGAMIDGKARMAYGFGRWACIMTKGYSLGDMCDKEV
jgi:hypothetical protein